MSDRHWFARTQRYVLAGVLTAIPILITWFVFTFILGQLSAFGAPWVRALGRAAHELDPQLTKFVLHPWFEPLIAVILTLLALYVLGWTATHVIGRKLIALFDALMHRIPLVQTIYGGTKKLLTALQQKPDQLQRVVLIEFPSPDMKTVGLVTRVFTEAGTGRQLAAVYVPTTPNPTSGYLEIVPVEKLVSLDWTMDQAMTFIISGGAVAPEQIRYSRDDEIDQRAAGQAAQG